MKSLVVDDEVVSRKKLVRLLEAFGDCDSVENGFLAVDQVKKSLETKKYYQLIALDIEMPGLDGIETLVQIRNMESSANIDPNDCATVMMVTSHADKGFVFKALENGADDYLVKPFNKQSVLLNLSRLGLITENQLS